MKKSILLFAGAAAIAALFCCSCQQERFVEELETVDVSTANVVKSISFSVDAFEAEEDAVATRSTYDASGNYYFAANDTVGIFPDKGAQVYFEIAGEFVGKQAVTFDGGGWALKDDRSYWSYSPLVGDFYLKKNHIPVEFVDLTQDGNGTLDHISPVDFLYSDRRTVQNGTLSFTYHRLNCILRPRVTLPAGTYSKIVIQAESEVFVSKGYYDMTADTPSIIGTEYTDHLTLNLKNASFDKETAFVANFMTAPVDIKGIPIKIIIYSGASPLYYYTYTMSKIMAANTPYGLSCTDLQIYADENTSVYNKVTSITAGGTYLILDTDEQRVFKGATNGSFMDVSPQNNILLDTNGSLTGFEFTVENNDDKYFLKFNDGKYLVCSYNGNSAAGLAYVNARNEINYPFALSTGADGSFFFSTTQANSTSITNQEVLYYNKDSRVFKIGSSGKSIGVHLYMKDMKGAKLDRGLCFYPESVTCTLGTVPAKPTLSGTYTNVTYQSGDSHLAVVDAEGNVTPLAPGIVTITATAEEDEQYSAGSASYTLRIKNDSSSGTYVRVTSIDQINLEGEYVIVYENGTTQKAFKPILNAGKNAFSTNSDNAVDVLIIDDEMDAAEADACRFTLANQAETGKKFSLVIPEADGMTDYYFIVYGREESNSGIMTVFFASPTATGYRSTFSLSPDGVMTLAGNSSYNFRYNTAGYFTAGTASSDHLYLFIRTGSAAKQKQTLSFAEETVSWALGDNHEIGLSYPFPQEVSGAQTAVTYTAAPESVAKIENGRIKIVGSGAATITATAAKTDQYYAASASYTLRILKAAPTDWVDLGTINLENKALEDYLTDAEQSYTDTNDAEKTVMPNYCSSSTYSAITRKDCPVPVTISWTNPASGSTDITIYEDENLTRQVLSQKAKENTTEAAVYNLIPGRKYYYTVSENTTLWEKGFFSTTGRRRMIKVSDTRSSGHANNCRDLGGLKVTDKGEEKTIRYGYLFRGSNMDATTETERSLLTGFLNVGMDIDLRNGSTAGNNLGANGSQNCYQPFASPLMGYINPGFSGGKTIADLTTPAKVAQVVNAIFNTVKSGKATYFHCYIGADRTGYIAMLIEGLLGVSEKDCSIDYELTSFSEAAGKRFRNAEPPAEDYTFREGIAFLRDKEGATFQDKIENYLVNTVGIDKNDIDDFKGIILESKQTIP